MFYVGLDIHSKHISICVLNETGQFVHRARVRTINDMMRILEGLQERFEVCYEASCGYGHFHDLLRPLAARVLVAHPGQLRLIYRSKNKNDRNDAERLAKLLYLGEVPTDRQRSKSDPRNLLRSDIHEEASVKTGARRARGLPDIHSASIESADTKVPQPRAVRFIAWPRLEALPT